MQNENIYYKIGYYFGYFLQGLMYVAIAWGSFNLIRNHEFPYLPLILLFSYFTFKKSATILEYVKSPVVVHDEGKLTEEDVVRLINNVNYWYSKGAGPN
jgi:hypothetical protein